MISNRIGRAGRFVLAVACVVLVLPTGCVLPSDFGDLDYPTYGGAWERTRRDGGRVGSVFDPAGARAATLSPRSDPRMEETARSPAESILSVPPEERSGRGAASGDDGLEPAPSRDRLDRDRLRALELDEIGIELGAPAPPDLL